MNYSEIGIPVRRIPVAVEVSPVRVGIEPGNLLANLSIGLFSFTEIPRKESLYFMT